MNSWERDRYHLIHVGKNFSCWEEMVTIVPSRMFVANMICSRFSKWRIVACFYSCIAEHLFTTFMLACCHLKLLFVCSSVDYGIQRVGHRGHDGEGVCRNRGGQEVWDRPPDCVHGLPEDIPDERQAVHRPPGAGHRRPNCVSFLRCVGLRAYASKLLVPMLTLLHTTLYSDTHTHAISVSSYTFI